MARWDGCRIYKGSPHKEWQDITAADADVHGIRTTAGHQPEFDIALSRRERTEDWDHERQRSRSVPTSGSPGRANG